jgi:hypothetical protein
VADCAVVAREDEPGERRLVAYVVGPAGADELRAHLRRALPEPMVPSAFVPLAALPLSPSGKVERRALPAPDPAAGGERYLAPRTPVERALAAIWADALRLERVGVRDDFLAIGGHSLVATRVVARIRAELDGDVGVTTLFENPTIEALAPFLSRRADRAPPPLAAGAGSSPHRLLASLDALSDEELDRLLAGNP